MNTVRWGILGCGRIARKFASDLKYVSDGRLVAVGSRSKTNAQAFAREFPVAHVHDSYESLIANPEVDVIYIASPHGLHHEHTLMCLESKKAVLCEKAFALNSRQAREMVSKARQEKVFLMEALWTKFLPHYQQMQSLLSEQRLGEIRSMLVNFGFIPQAPVPQRLFNPALGGGTMLDIGIYNVFMALSVLGRPEEVEAIMDPTDTGVDAQCAVTFKYRNGAIAQLFSTFMSNLATEADINGSLGRLRLTTRFYEPSATLELYPGRPDSRQVIPVGKEPGTGYQYEARHVNECLKKNLTESPVMTHEDSLLLMETLDRVRQSAGIVYPADL
ncbi:MAG TPA: Gfo/Idh/MocA family oxidoreductase [Puia sp.]|nr:Gfo/Idh/MocA family oxidoreductase [Puia sp.]